MKKLSFATIVLSAFMAACAMPAAAQKALTDARNRMQTAEAMFQEHCKSSGEKIYKTVDNVDSIFLLKVRPDRMNYHDQFTLDDPYGRDSSGEYYIKTFFSGFYRANSGRALVGYRHVDVLDPKDGERYRYTGSVKDVVHTSSILMGGDGKTKFTTREFLLDRVPATGPMPRYGVTYDDISTHEDREYWIAGSSLKVIDLQTNKVIAERIGYLIDLGQGNTSGGRSPWLLAAYHACPAFPADPGGHPVQEDQTRNFVTKILKPTAEK